MQKNVVSYLLFSKKFHKKCVKKDKATNEILGLFVIGVQRYKFIFLKFDAYKYNKNVYELFT